MSFQISIGSPSKNKSDKYAPYLVTKRLSCLGSRFRVIAVISRSEEARKSSPFPSRQVVLPVLVIILALENNRERGFDVFQYLE